MKINDYGDLLTDFSDDNKHCNLRNRRFIVVITI